MSCGCTETNAASLTSSSQRQILTHGACSGACGDTCGGTCGTTGTTPSPIGRSAETECGKGLPPGLLSAFNAMHPGSPSPPRSVLEPFGEIAVGDDGNMFFGLTECLRRSVVDGAWEQILRHPGTASAIVPASARCTHERWTNHVSSAGPDPAALVRAMLGRTR